MKYRNLLSIALLIISFFNFVCYSKEQAITAPVAEYYKDILPLTEPIKAIASDWDNVVSVRDRWIRWTGVAKAICSKIGLATRLCNAEIREDIGKSWNWELKDFNGDTIYGVGDFVDYFAQKYDPAIADIKPQLVDALTAVKPIWSTISLYQQLALPVVIWTNNDFLSYQLKLKSLNEKLKLTKAMPFEPIAVFVAGKNRNISDERYGIKGKPHESYYVKAYHYTKKELNLNDADIVVFIDDLAANVNGAREVAKKYKLPLIAIQYTTPEQLEHDINLLMVLSEQDAEFMQPKELDEYLFYRENRIV